MLTTAASCIVGASTLILSISWISLLYEFIHSRIHPVHATTNVVTTLADSGPGSLCTVLANAFPGDDAIGFFAQAGILELG